MDWNSGYSASYYAAFIDPHTWRDLDRFEITGGSIKRSDDDLRCSASFDCPDYERGTERWIRLYLDARQGSGSTRVALFTGLATSPSIKFSGRMRDNTIECYSVLKPAEDVLLDRGWYAPAGVSGSALIRQLLSVIPAPIEEADGAPTLTEAIIAEDGESRLTMASKVLKAIGWRLRVDGDGTVRIIPTATEPSAVYDPLENDAVEPDVEVEQDWYECPNVFRAVADDVSAVVRDDSLKSPLSTISRGREVWLEETDCDLNDGESVAEYALRRLKEEQKVATAVKYVRRFNPDVMTGDLVRLHYPEQGIDGIYEVTSQSIELGHGARTSEEVVKR